MLIFILTSVGLGVGLAMDAFSVSIANGLREPRMSRGRTCLIAGCYGFFQYLMPVLGWFFVHLAAERFVIFQRFIPWIALALLVWIGGKMLLEGIGKLRTIRGRKTDEDSLSDMGGGQASGTPSDGDRLGLPTLLLQGVATSIDALSVGFTIASYNVLEANGAALIIALVTLGICLLGLRFGKAFGNRLADKASIVGGLILIAIGLEIFLTGIL